ncbi:SpoIIIAH-like family protein [Bacillus methanolicus]|uniref:Stage III sporulation protein AH n=1 Tax=Bacillus methanolicus (strain MGA3 / ATCC 53907) TaxID=796606 RepID=I3EAC2_BACMM|nr:SpoIIIAH-like family protein [Bacillus methanolicus]AIE60683.1 stage III sporulation protein AH [Bacillus methanolicus MGA3]EIJ83443.1 stage III sporulation protein AH [Bacillus methanolicus MGA3]UQD52698.1 SpoIIIAH-like family protein [Bacillus methanolicus]
MLLKKQTVWLLTMLSLVVVLSVYYITSPEQNGNSMAGIEQKSANQKTAVKGKDNKAATSQTDAGAKITSEPASDEVFEALRMDLDDQRSKRKEELENIVASTDLPTEKRNQAYDEMKKLDETAIKEDLLESLIKAMNYEDALVQVDGGQVRITVKADKLSPSAANDIIQMVKQEINGLQHVAVKFQPKK